MDLDTRENNILIAEFMGAIKTVVDYTEYNEDGTIQYTANEDGSKWLVDEYSEPKGLPKNTYWGAWKLCYDLKYTKSWDWLMPVIEKIETLGAEIIIGRMFCEINYTDLKNSETFQIRMASRVKFNAVNSVVIQFIKWYNLHY